MAKYLSFLALFLTATSANAAFSLPALFFFFSDDPEPQQREPIREQRSYSSNQVRVYDRPAFQFQYPADWTIATRDADHQPDSHLTLDTPGGSLIKIELFHPQGMTPAQAVKNTARLIDGTLVDTYSRSQFSSWGPFRGQGVHLKGEVMAFDSGGARVFYAQLNPQAALMVTELYYSSDLADAMHGYDLIAKTLRFK